MKNLNKLFSNRVISFDKLVSYGFKIKNRNYIYEKNICDSKFKVVVSISSNNKTSQVIDLITCEEYILADIENTNGEFVGKIKKEYDGIIENIIKECTTFEAFQNKQSKEVIRYIKEKYDDSLEFLWEKYDDCAIWRNKKNNKWYGLIMVISKEKLGFNSNEKVEIIDLRYQKQDIKNIIDNKKVFGGYHMNKNSWITIILDGSLDISKIKELIDNSYNLSISSK